MAKIIDLSEKRFDSLHPYLYRGLSILDAMTDTDKERVYKTVMAQVVAQTKINLGLVEWDSDHIPHDLFDMVNKVYEEFGKGCYFCDPKLDPNASEFTPKRGLCPNCQMKLGNIMIFLGFRQETIQKLMPLAGQRGVQKLNMTKRKADECE